MDKKRCDVVVIGAGIGGLCLATRLAYAGYKVIVLEQMPILGGRYTYVDHNGYLLPTGAIGVYYGDKDPVLRTLRDVGVKVNLETKAFPPPVWRFGGKDYQMPDKGMVGRLISIASRNKQEEDRVNKALRRCMHWQEPSPYTTFSEWLLQLTDNKTIYNIFENISVQLVGPNIWEYPANEFFIQLRNFARTQQLIPRTGLGIIIDLLAKAIKDNKGEILTKVEAQKILVHDGIATGIVAKGSEGEFQIEARVVVSNAGPKKTVELAGEDNFDRGYIKTVREVIIHTGFEFFLSSDGPLCEYPGGLYTIDTRRTLVWLDCTLTWPEWAPKGKNWMLCYQAPGSMSLYDPRKEYQSFLADLAETFPNFHKQNGEILVAHHFSAEWPVMFAVPGYDLRQRTPIENLYNVGDGVKTPGWLAGSGASDSARVVAEDIMARMKKPSS